MQTDTKTTYRIKAEFSYYPGTCYAPVDGYLTGHDTDAFTGRQIEPPLEFETLELAIEHLTENDEQHGGLNCEHDGEGLWSYGGQYCCSHGEYSRPVYRIVSAVSGRCTKAIVSAIETLDR